jgi:hypothetical protein
MKTHFINIVLPLLFSFLSSALLFSCTEDDTKPDPTAGLVKISEGYALGAAAKVEIWANEDLFAGYNSLFFALYDSVNGERITDSHIQLHPAMDMHTMSHSCPVEEPEEHAVKELFPAAVMFTMPSGDMGAWSLEVGVHNHLNELYGKAIFEIDVKSTAPSRIVSFQTSSGQRYYLSYKFPEKKKVGVSEFEVIAYTSAEGEFIPAEDLTINFTPEMPSMDHGSPNNVNPVHTSEGHYKGKANFTMTGEWRLNLELMSGTTSLGTKYFDVIVQ